MRPPSDRRNPGAPASRRLLKPSNVRRTLKQEGMQYGCGTTTIKLWTPDRDGVKAGETPALPGSNATASNATLQVPARRPVEHGAPEFELL
jgi:hypothetical protein